MAAQNTATEADETVTRLMKVAEVTGLGFAIFNYGQVAYLKAYGFRDRDKNLPLKVNSVMPAASLSKVAFEYLVMELADEAQLDRTSRFISICRSRCRRIRIMWRGLRCRSRF